MLDVAVHDMTHRGLQKSQKCSYFLEIDPEDAENVLVMEKVMEIVGKVRNYSPNAKHLEEERRQVEIRLREEEEAHQAEAKLREEEEEEERAQCWEEWVQTHTTLRLGSIQYPSLH